jgi:hypothetical protein
MQKKHTIILKLWKVLRTIKINKKIISGIKELYRNSVCKSLQRVEARLLFITYSVQNISSTCFGRLQEEM